MSSIQNAATELRVPLRVIESATSSLLQMLRRHGCPDDVQNLLERWEEAARLLEQDRDAIDEPGILARIDNYVFAMPSTSWSARNSLLRAGLTESSLAPFVAGFVGEALAHMDDATLARMVVRVPGLTRLCPWPLSSAQA